MRYRKKESSEFRERGCASLVIMKRVDVFHDLVSGFSTDLDVKKKKKYRRQAAKREWSILMNPQHE